MITINKKLKIFFICFISITILFGCSNSKIKRNNINLDETKTELVDDSINQIEIANILNDIELYIQMRTNSNNKLNQISENKDDKVNIKNKIILYELMENVYKLSTNRIASDIDTIYLNSIKYKSYIAMLQVYADTFLEEKDVLYKYLIEENDNIIELKCMKMFLFIDEFYNEMLSNIIK